MITGLKEVQSMLAALSAKESRAVSKSAMKMAARPVREAAKRLIPLGAGRAGKSGKMYHLKNNIVIRVGRSKKGVRINVQQNAGPFKGETFYGSFVELGYRSGRSTRAIRRAQRQGNESVDTRKKIQGKWYMKQAGDQTEQQAVDIYERALIQWLKQEAS